MLFSESELLVYALLLVLSPFGLTLAHELGHALMALALGIRINDFQVGSGKGLGLRLGSLRIRLSLYTAKWEGTSTAGLVQLADDPGPKRLLAVVMAGPAANVAAAAALVVIGLHETGGVAFGLFLVAAESLVAAVANARPSGDPPSEPASDGMLALCAWRAIRNQPPPAARPRKAATVVSPPEGPALRPVFAVLLAFCAVLALIVSPLAFLALLLLLGPALLPDGWL